MEVEIVDYHAKQVDSKLRVVSYVNESHTLSAPSRNKGTYNCYASEGNSLRVAQKKFNSTHLVHLKIKKWSGAERKEFRSMVPTPRSR